VVRGRSFPPSGERAQRDPSRILTDSFELVKRILAVHASQV
jgi:hypothetical protein